MPLTDQQIDSLLTMISITDQDDLDCGKCFEYLAEFAEVALSNQEIPDAIKNVKVHLQQCPCCQDEFNALLDGLKELKNES